MKTEPIVTCHFCGAQCEQRDCRLRRWQIVDAVASCDLCLEAATFDPRVDCDCGASVYPGGWCFACGAYNESKTGEDNARV